jgi:hypothetical protein
MRGNILNMVTHRLMKETGVHEGEEMAFYDWLPALLVVDGGSKNTLPNRKSITTWLKGFNPPSRIGRCLALSPQQDMVQIVVNEIIVPLLTTDRRILVCGTSHESVDFLLEEILKAITDTMKARISRIASRPEDTSAGVKDVLLPEDWCNRIDEIESSRSLVACTVKAVHHDLLCRGDFDFSIILGADKVPDPSLWGVLLRCRQAVLLPSLATNILKGEQEESLKDTTCKEENPFDEIPMKALFHRLIDLKRVVLL